MIFPIKHELEQMCEWVELCAQLEQHVEDCTHCQSKDLAYRTCKEARELILAGPPSSFKQQIHAIMLN